MDTFTLKSSPLCFAPGVIRAVYDTWDANPEWAKEIVSCWTDDQCVHKAIREGNYTISNDVVIVEVRHPDWCIKAAEIITNEEYGDSEGEKLSTEYGEKNCIGVADIIYRHWRESNAVSGDMED